MRIYLAVFEGIHRLVAEAKDTRGHTDESLMMRETLER